MTTPAGANSFVQAEAMNNEGHYDACGNRQQELLHRPHLLVMDSEDRPTDYLRQSAYNFNDTLRF